MKKRLICLFAAADLLLPVAALAADPTDHPHHLAAVGGMARHDDENSGYVGIDYSYRLLPEWSLGVFYEEVSGDFDLQAWGLAAIRHFHSGWKFSFGPGAEHKLKKNKTLALFRLSLGYDWHLGKWSVGPALTWDLIESGENTGYAGVALGYGF